MANTCYQLTHAAEIYSDKPGDCGPTGDWAEVTAGEVRDYGGNVLFAGSADACIRFLKNRMRTPTRLVPTVWKKFTDGEVCGADHTWQLVIEGK